jgi:hypothetical protein
MVKKGSLVLSTDASMLSFSLLYLRLAKGVQKVDLDSS